MEENKKQEIDVNVEGVILKASFITEKPTASEARLASGKTLRREYIYKLYDEHIQEFGVAPSEVEIEVFAVDARKLYMNEGDYKVVNGEATWLGEF